MPGNERTIRQLRRFLPKEKSINRVSAEQVLMFAAEINAAPRKRLDYHTPDELFEAHLDRIYAVACV